MTELARQAIARNSTSKAKPILGRSTDRLAGSPKQLARQGGFPQCISDALQVWKGDDCMFNEEAAKPLVDASRRLPRTLSMSDLSVFRL
jgi:hypothetical protein